MRYRRAGRCWAKWFPMDIGAGQFIGALQTEVMHRQ